MKGLPSLSRSACKRLRSSTRSRFEGVEHFLSTDQSIACANRCQQRLGAVTQQFLAGLPSAVRANLISFGDGVREEVPFTGTLDAAARDQLTSAINALQPAEPVGTALYDAVVTAVDQQERQFGAQRNIVIFSDGADSGSDASLAEAVAAVESAGAATTTVFLDTTGRTDEAGLRALAEAVDGGAFLRVENTAALQTAFVFVAWFIVSCRMAVYQSRRTHRLRHEARALQ